MSNREHVGSPNRVFVPVDSGSRGQGFWTAGRPSDPNNPSIDAKRAKRTSANKLVGGADDAADPDMISDQTYVKLFTDMKDRLAKQKVKLAEGRASYNGLAGFLGKAIKTSRMDLFMTDPEKLSEEDLIKAVGAIKASMQAADTPGVEREAMRSFARGVSKALKNIAAAKNIACKAILTKDPAARAEEEKKPAKPSLKTESKQANARGKTAYKYPKKNGGKAPDKVPKKKASEPAVEAPPSATPDAPLTPPKPVDPNGLCANLGVSVKQLRDFAGKKHREEFIDFFMQQKKLTEQLKLTTQLLGGVYDTLTQLAANENVKPAPDAALDASPGKMPATGGAPAAKRQTLPPTLGKGFGKTEVTFRDIREDKGILGLLKSRTVRNVGDIQKVVREYLACDGPSSIKMTRSLLRTWENEGVITLNRG